MGSQQAKTITDAGSDTSTFGFVGIVVRIQAAGDVAIGEAVGDVFPPSTRFQQDAVFLRPETQGAIASSVAPNGATNRGNQLTKRLFTDH